MFLLLSEVKKRLKREIHNKSNREILLNIADDYIEIGNGIYYKDEDDNLYVGSDIIKYIKYDFSKKSTNKLYYFPKFKYSEIKFDERYIKENGIEVDYEKSNYLNERIKKSEKYQNPKIKIVLTDEEKLKLKKGKEKQYQEKLKKRELKRKSKQRKFKKLLNDEKNILSFDMEIYEKNNHKILEIGYSFYNGKTKELENKNLVISENLELKNGKYVANNKFMFLFGETLFMKEKDAFDILYSKMKEADLFVGHSLHNDMKFIESRKSNHINIYDTSVCINPNELGLKRGQIPSLKTISEHFGLEPKYLHNAGNDAYYTLQSAFKSIA